MKHDDATLRQIKAANPKVSTWLSANAGSGKTRVLTDRVARLLLEGVSPQNILCLTYTKAAATNMQNQLFKRLGKWAMLDDPALIGELEKLGASIPDNVEKLAHARTLFARAIEAPGGLRIQTIHSFCSSLLRRFPLEAGVSPVFREMEDRAAKLLREDVVEQIANGPQVGELHRVAQHYTGEVFDKLTREIIRHRDVLSQPKSQADIWAQFGLPVGFSDTNLLKQVFLGEEPELFEAIIPLLKASTKVTDHKAAVKLAAINVATPNVSDLENLFPIFLYRSGANINLAKTNRFPTKEVREANPEIVGTLHQLMERVEAVHEQSCGLYSAKKTLALFQFAAEFLPAYEARKAARGWLDFDDLIGRAVALLSDPVVAQWVLFRLDGGIDHILVDEAQDTSPDQWRVIELLAQEFSAGLGARADIRRTIFVVGDLKQSIYSFQGADPRAFDRMRKHFSTGLEASDQRLYERSLEHSFRSSSAILELVDATFRESGGAGVGGPPSHLAFHNSLPGRVDLWPVEPVVPPNEEKEWYDPTDRLATNDHRVLLAEKIAEQIVSIQKYGSIPDDSGGFRRVRYEDFLILVQRRSDLFHEIIRACKSRNLPMAGADRLRIGAELAVKDLMALMSFLALPEDNLSLAACLRSPLFSVTETELFDLAHHRQKTTLWSALVRSKDRFPNIVEALTKLRNQVDFFSPFELLERILTRHHGRKHLLARLGPEAEDGIDALLSQAIAYERTETPSLTGFLVWLEADDIEIKRQSDNVGGRIRVMTTHGAKGLESPIVILPDTGDRKARLDDEIISGEDSVLMWRSNAERQPAAMKEILAQKRIAQEEERMRLLYVALTRAEKWLIVCASGDVKEDGNSWYRYVETGMNCSGAVPVEMPTGTGLRLEHGDWADVSQETSQSDEAALVELPNWASTHAASPVARPITISPSDMGGEKSLAGDIEDRAEEAALKRGSQIHLLLEHFPNFPEQDWLNIATQLFGESEDEISISDLLFESAAVLNNPDFAHIFGPDSLAEVEISATLPGAGNQRIRGTIDRMLIFPERILIVDFKSNRLVPDRATDTPTGVLRQMAVYLEAVEQVYPNHKIELAILWTNSTTLMPLPHDIVRESLATMPRLDAPQHDP